MMFLFLGLFLLLLAVILAVYVYAKEVYAYRKLIVKPEDLVKEGVNLQILDYPNLDLTRVIKVGGRSFSGKILNWALFKDIRQLKKIGYQLQTVYYGDFNKPLTEDLLGDLLGEYWEKILLWSKENQGRPELKNKPKAPYVYSESTLFLPHAGWV